MKILNAYAGIGGNRKLWGDSHEITAVEFDPKIAAIYQDLYPNDTVIVGDAHEYLLNHYQEFDFIWCSPPCPTHSVMNYTLNSQGVIRYSDMNLYQEIVLLKHFYKGKWCVENVKRYYDPLIQPQVSCRHYFWSNIVIPAMKSRVSPSKIWGRTAKGTDRQNEFSKLGFDLSKYSFYKKEKLLRNCVDPMIGKAILDKVLEIDSYNKTRQGVLF